ncbi:uncharacterized protein [Nicotiana tomentosiformis]|uniref:uncharacterized protein n=1 Tax=Nicotiana tomentosiformis TaxID=4098 RepID=UPI00388C666E
MAIQPVVPAQPVVRAAASEEEQLRLERYKKYHPPTLCGLTTDDAQGFLEECHRIFRTMGDHLEHPQEMFDILRKYNMKPNPQKCAFGVGSGAETRYPHLERLSLAPLVSSRKLRPYFQCYPIAIVTTFLLRNVLHNPELSGHLAKWVVEVNEFDITYKPTTAIKSQVLTDFVANFSPRLMSLAGKEAVLVSWSIIDIPREENVEAGALANLGSSTEIKGSDFGAFVQLLHSMLDVDDYCKINSTNLIWDWRNEFIEYLIHCKFPEDAKASRALRTKVARYSLADGQLYRRSFQGPLARCLGASEADYVMREVHDGAESTNKVIIKDLKKKLKDAKGKWPDDLLGVLWAYRTTAKSRTGETPFSLMYGSEALMPVEVGEPTLRFSRANKEKNNEAFLVKLDLLEEHWDLEYVRMVAQNQSMERYYNRKENL